MALLLILPLTGTASRLKKISITDHKTLMLVFRDGEVDFKDDGQGETAFQNRPAENRVIRYGAPFNVMEYTHLEWWTISPFQGSTSTHGMHPTACYRKSKINGMAQYAWNNAQKDYDYEMPFDHAIYLTLPRPLKQGRTYRIQVDSRVAGVPIDTTFVYDEWESVSEAIHVNIVGYVPGKLSKCADLYMWMGDGGYRDYRSYEGNAIYLYNVQTRRSEKVGTVRFWMNNVPDVGGNDLTKSPIWDLSFVTDASSGTYRLVVENVGCSQDFKIDRNVYKDPFDVSMRGYFYMRIGEEGVGISPKPRRPLFIPGKLPENTVVYCTEMSPYHPEWTTFSTGDVWDRPTDWARFKQAGAPVNLKAVGGHSDACDWDRHLGHVANVYDLLLPYILTKGKVDNDDCGISESDNHLPDLLDEVRYEVDFWLNLRDQYGYSHGITCPSDRNEFYQAKGTAVAAWANAANAAMLSDAFRLAGNDRLMEVYRDSAVNAFRFASALPDQQLDQVQNMGFEDARGKDLKMTAAVYLYNVTGDRAYEDVFANLCDVTDDKALVVTKQKAQLWACAGYLFTNRTVHYPMLRQHIANAVTNQAMTEEVEQSARRPSRRSSNSLSGYFYTAQTVQLSLVAHAICDDPIQKDKLLTALLAEADWELGRNSENRIFMTTASTTLENKRSVENCYSTGQNDGVKGMHPGHTPYFNLDDWAPGMVMGRPSYLLRTNYPSYLEWPRAELIYNTRYVWSHSEFTPRQTMRGKAALYTYLYAVFKG